MSWLRRGFRRRFHLGVHCEQYSETITAAALKQTIGNLEADRNREAVETDTLSSLLWTCLNSGALPEGKRVHKLIQQQGGEAEKVLSRQIIQMYLKCGGLAEAREVVDRMKIGDVVTWTRILAAYARSGDCDRSIQAYQEMLLSGVKPNKITIVTLLNACVEQSCLPDTAQIRSNVYEMGFLTDAVVATVLLSMHSRFGRIEDAFDAFCEIERHDVISWNAMLWVYAENGYSEETMILFREMQLEGSLPSKVSFLAIFNAIAAAANAAEAKVMHSLFLGSGIERDLALGNAIVDMFGKCSCLDEALEVFNSMAELDVISWTAMIAAFVQCGATIEALHCFRLMQLHGDRPNKVTFLTVLNSGEIQIPVEEARRVYGYVVEAGLAMDTVLATALVTMFGNCRDAQHAKLVFDRLERRDVVLWTVIIAAHAQSGENATAMELFHAMQLEGFRPNKASLIIVVDSLGSSGSIEQGRRIHDRIMEQELDRDYVILGNALINMYIRCGDVDGAWKCFRRMPIRDESTWNVMLTACGDDFRLATAMFAEMQQQGLAPNKITLLAIINSCVAGTSTLPAARKVHASVIEAGLEREKSIANALVDMYSKCGNIQAASEVFSAGRLFEADDAVAWNALVLGHTQHGSWERARGMFWEMQQQGVKATEVSLVGVLASLSHAGIVQDGCRLFASMETDFGIDATAEHRGCVVDLLSKMGCLAEAEEFMRNCSGGGGSSGWREDCVGWLTLLGASSVHGDVERGLRAAYRLLELDGISSAAHVVLANLLSSLDKENSL